MRTHLECNWFRVGVAQMQRLADLAVEGPCAQVTTCAPFDNRRESSRLKPSSAGSISTDMMTEGIRRWRREAVGLRSKVDTTEWQARGKKKLEMCGHQRAGDDVWPSGRFAAPFRVGSRRRAGRWALLMSATRVRWTRVR